MTVIEPAAWWLHGERRDAVEFDAFLRRLICREVNDDDVIEFLWRAGVGLRGTDFRSLASWPVWHECRNALSWFGPQLVESAVAGISGLEALERPVLCVRGTETAPWLHDVVDGVAQRVPRASILDLPRGHACLLQNPMDFVAAVSRHVRAARAA